METPKPKSTLFRWLPALGIVLVVGTSLLFMMCAVSDNAVESNIAELRVAAENLRENPQDKESLALLVNQLSHRNRLFRSNAAAVLGETVAGADHLSAALAPEAVPALAKLLDKTDQFDQRAGAAALRQFGAHALPAVAVLRKRLTPSDHDVAWFSADAIRNIGSPAAEALPELTRALSDQVNRCHGSTSPCAKSFIPAIGAIGPRAAAAKPDLEALLGHRDPYLRMAAAVALLQIDGQHTRASSVVAELLKSNEPHVKETTLSTLNEAKVSFKP